MNLSTIEQGEELLKASTPGPWFYDGIGYLFQGTPHDAQMVADDGDGKQIRMRGTGADLPLDVNGDLIAFLRNHASELLQMAREVERLKEEANCMHDEIVRLGEPPALSVDDYKRWT